MKSTSILYASFIYLLLFTSAMAATTSQTIYKIKELAVESDPVYQKHFELTITTPWLDAKEHDGIVYLLFESPARLERYNMISQSWMTDIALNDTPTAFAADDTALFISFGRRTSRFNLDGSGETHLRNTNYDVSSLLINNDFLLIHYGYSLLSVNKLTGTLVDSKEYWYSMQGLSIAPSINKIFARSTGVSPSDILQITLNNDGTLGDQNDSNYHGDYPSAVKTYVFPDQTRVAENSGIVYDTTDLIYSNSLAGNFDDLAFYGNWPVVLRNSHLISYSNSCLETGRYTPENPPQAIFIYGENIFSFYEDTTETKVDVFPFNLLKPVTPGTPTNPNGLVYTPDDIIFGQGEIVYLFSSVHSSIFRWSVAQQKYLDTIPLLAEPSYIAYNNDSNRLYLAYPSGEITVIILDQGIDESFIVNSPQTPCGLSMAGQFVFVCDPSGAWVSHFTYSPDGILLSQEEWNYFSDEYVWNAKNQKMYFFRDGSPDDLVWEDIDSNGIIGDKYDSPYHSSEGFKPPIRVTPNGSTVLLGSGRIYDAISLEQVDTLSNDIFDALWQGGTLLSLRSYNNNSEVQTWTARYAVEAKQQVEGSPLRLFSTNEGFLVITEVNGMPKFLLLEEAPTPPPPGTIKALPYLPLLLDQ